MNTLIVCLGYSLDKGQLSALLKNRLNDTIRLLNENPDSTTLLMGSRSYRDSAYSETEAAKMEEYILAEDPKLAARIRIEDKTTSTIEQLCLLREMLDDKNPLIYGVSKAVFIASEIACERVKLYAEYIFNATSDFEFFGSSVPEEVRKNFISVEKFKLEDAKLWLGNHTRGDYQTILSEHHSFQQKVKAGKVDHPKS